MPLVLVDTSSWVHQLRRGGDVAVRARVEALLRSGEAAWCPVVRLELWNGVGSAHDRKVLREYAQALPELSIDEGAWQRSYRLADLCRARGLTIPVTDLLVAACARAHGVSLEHDDRHFSELESLES